ncbi:MAG: hypothetical protein AAF357_05540 [Verrucomicrobiota bacterium]
MGLGVDGEETGETLALDPDLAPLAGQEIKIKIESKIKKRLPPR